MSGAAPLIVDASVIYAAADARDQRHQPAAGLLHSWPGELVISPFVAAEVDHLILERLDLDTEFAFLESLAEAFTVPGLDPDELRTVAELCQRYRDLRLGLADASTIVLAARWRTRQIATFDQRHFRAVEPIGGGAFQLLPGDAG